MFSDSLETCGRDSTVRTLAHVLTRDFSRESQRTTKNGK
jgi:hypothetical protein